ncbi:FAD-dependent oxidoreductase [Nocardia sp. NPDC057353]|uniref:FAD-dependent oxidoreductase n=1 Tax=Nocardia sp. NPDC057353 TaxID=3346104 RepID=UPI00363865A7
MHAIVLGAGMGGLLAARVLSEHFDRVTVLERDRLPEQPRARRGVPQGKHVHGLLPRGAALLEEFFPGLRAELVASGAVECAALEQVRFAVAGHQLARAATGHVALQASRPHLEHHVRARVAALPGVEIRDGVAALDLSHDPRGGRVTGVLVRDGDGDRRLDADLVVASMGRGSAVNSWLERFGYAPPAAEGTPIDIVYTSAFARLPAGALAGELSITAGVRTAPPRALAMFAVEGGRHIVTLIGFGGEKPPVDTAEFASYAAHFAPADVVDALARAEYPDPSASFRYKANLRRRYERLSAFPDGLLVTGDTLCSFSPVYGQGMTVAAIQMAVLRTVLESGTGDLARRFYRAVRPEIDHAWQLTVAADGAMPHVTPEGPVARAAVAALDPILIAAERDPRVAAALFQVIGLVERPSSLLTPELLARIGAASAGALLESALRTAGGGITRALTVRTA